MSEYEDSEMEMDEQSEDGEIKKSPSKKSPLTSKDKENEENAFSISSEEEADTADSLDIKPPQAAVHHKDRNSGRKRDKSERAEKRSHKESHRSKGHHRPREHREHRDREDRHREKRHHRERREARESRREARDMGRDRGSSSASGSKDKDRNECSGLGGGSGALIMEDLRERLDREKRRAAAVMAATASMSSGGLGRKEEGGRGGRSGEEQEIGGRRREDERRGGIRDHEAPLPPPPPRETQREKAERVEKEKRRERLLIADREMVRQKEVWRRELEARRERRHLEQQAQERTLRDVARQGERNREKLRVSRAGGEKGGGDGGGGGGDGGGGGEKGEGGDSHEDDEEDDDEDDEDDDDEEEEEEDEESEEEEEEEERISSSERAATPSRMKEQEAVNLVTEEEEDEEDEEDEKVGGGGMEGRKGGRGGREEEEERGGGWEVGGGDGLGGGGNQTSPDDSGSDEEEEESSGRESDSSTDTDEDADTDESRHKIDDHLVSPDSKLMAKLDDRVDGERKGGANSGTNGDMLRMETSRKRVRVDDEEEDEEGENAAEERRRRRRRAQRQEEEVGGNGRDEVDGDGIPYVNDESPKSDVVLREEEETEEVAEGAENEHPAEEQVVLPPYLPAIQGCRNVEEFQCLNRIEEGTYGIVYRARDKRTDEIVALKRLKMEKEKEGFPITSLREINTLLKAQHPNIVTVREIVVGSNMDKIFIVMDYVEHDLKSLMETMKQRKQVFIPGEVKCLMQQLLRAVVHLHDNWILHRDLKTSNLLLSHKGILKVGDFGLAREYGSPLKPYTPIVVTLWYRSPELLLCAKEYSTPVDMWSVGCIFGEFLSMEPLFPGKSEVDQLNKIFKDLGTPNERIWPGYSKLPAVQKMTFAEYPVSQMRSRFGTMLTDLGLDLMNRFLTYDPVQRVTAEDALRHEYFKEAPLPIDPAMFPTWPAKSELGHRKAPASPKPPSGGREYKQLGDTDDDVSVSGGFHMGVMEKGRAAIGAGFSLKF